MATQTFPASGGLSSPEHSPFEHSIFHGAYLALSRSFRTVVGFFDSLAAAQRATHHFNHLVHMGDAELSAQGLRREDIPQYVFEQNFNRR